MCTKTVPGDGAEEETVDGGGGSSVSGSQCSIPEGPDASSLFAGREERFGVAPAAACDLLDPFGEAAADPDDVDVGVGTRRVGAELVAIAAPAVSRVLAEASIASVAAAWTMGPEGVRWQEQTQRDCSGIARALLLRLRRRRAGAHAAHLRATHSAQPVGASGPEGRDWRRGGRAGTLLYM